MNLWLDDIRDPTEIIPDYWDDDTWVWAKTYDEATAAMEREPEFASLDHDLADEHYPWNKVDPSTYREKTGYNFIVWMAEFDIWPTKGIYVHSANVVGVQKMVGMLDRYCPFKQTSARGFGEVPWQKG